MTFRQAQKAAPWLIVAALIFIGILKMLGAIYRATSLCRLSFGRDIHLAASIVCHGARIALLELAKVV